LQYGKESFRVGLVLDKEQILWEKKTHASASITFRGDKLTKTSQYTIEELNDFLNMSSIEIGNEKVNIHFIDQFSAPLIKNFSHKKLSDVLSASSDIDRAHKLLKKVREEGLKATGSFSLLNKLIEESKLKLSDLELQVQKGIETKKILEEGSRQLESLQNTLETINNLINWRETYDKLYQRYKEVTQLIQLLKTIIQAKSQLENLNNLTLNYEYAKELELRVKDLQGLIFLLKQWKQLRGNLDRIYQTLNAFEKGLNLSKRVLSIKKFTLEKICPICGTQIEEKE
jgi:hypothetical protein